MPCPPALRLKYGLSADILPIISSILKIILLYTEAKVSLILLSTLSSPFSILISEPKLPAANSVLLTSANAKIGPEKITAKTKTNMPNRNFFFFTNNTPINYY